MGDAAMEVDTANTLQAVKIMRAENFYYTCTEQGEAVVLGANCWPEILTIPAVLGGCPVVTIGAGAFDAVAAAQLEGEQALCHRLKALYLPETLQAIEAYAFYGNYALTQVYFPQGIQRIGGRAFAGANLPTVCLPKRCKVYHEVNDAVWGAGGAFAYCAGRNIEGDARPMKITYYKKGDAKHAM
jgi:hypothetical protein